MVMTTPVHSMRSLHAFAPCVRSRSERVEHPQTRSGSADVAQHRRPTTCTKRQELNPSTGNAKATARAVADRATAKGELWR